MRLRALDLFCGAGGAGMGLHRAGFDVVGVDIKPQRRYPFDFIQADALAPPVRLSDFDLIWASPPCQAHSTIAKQQRSRRPGVHHHPDLVSPCRDMLRASGLPWIMENVKGAPLENPVQLCGSSFGLDVHRHRLFQLSGFFVMSPPCVHANQAPRFRSLDKRRAGKLARVVGVHGHLNYSGERDLRQKAMGIDWMDDYELTQAIPPDYSEYLGRAFMEAASRNGRGWSCESQAVAP